MSDIMETRLEDFGVLTEPGYLDRFPCYDLRGISAYCEEKGIDSSQLDDDELRQFEIR